MLTVKGAVVRHVVGSRASVEPLEPRRLLSAAADPVAAGLYHTTAQLSQARDQITTATIGAQALFAGGARSTNSVSETASDVVDVYDGATGRWSVLHLSAPRYGMSTATVDGKVVFFGGDYPKGSTWATSPAVDVYDAATGRITSTVVPHPHEAAVAVVGTKAIFAGGYVSFGGSSSDSSSAVDVYDAATGLWSTATLPHEGPVTPLVIGDKVIFATGNGAGEVDVYDATTGQWSNPAPLGGSIWNAAAVDGKAYLFRYGGQVDVYDGATGQWSTLTASGAEFTGQMTVVGTQVLFAGSSTGFVSDGTRLEVFDTVTGQFTLLTLPQAHYGVWAVAGTKAYFAGGATYAPSADTEEVDVYDASTGTLSAATLSQARDEIGAASLGGDVVFAGGRTTSHGQATLTDTVDVLDTATGQWTASRLSQARAYGASATVAGQALFAGGSASSDYYHHPADSAAVDLYGPSALTEPVAVAPADAAGVHGGGPLKLAWTASPGATLYDVYVDDALVATTNRNAFTLGAALSTGTHSWQVVARDGTQLTAGSRVTFDVGTPAAPARPAPGAHAALTAPLRQLAWTPSRGATSYDVYLDHAKIATVDVPSLTIVRPVAVGSHQWQVVARNAFAAVAGPRWSFTTAAPGVELTGSNNVTENRTAPAAVSVGGVVLFAGGQIDGNSRQPSAAVDLYDSATGQWSDAELSVARYDIAATAVGPYALFAGGVTLSADGNSMPDTDAVDVYNSATGEWTTAKLSKPAADLHAVKVGHLALFVDTTSGSADVFDADTGQWSTLTAPTDPSVAGFSVTAVGHQVFLAGARGSGPEGQVISSDLVYVYDADANTWSTAHLSTARWDVTATAVGPYAVFAGGTAQSPDYPAYVPVDTVDLYDTRTGQWSTARLSVARSGMAVTTAGNQLFFAGGDAINDGQSAAVDIFNADSGAWSTGSLLTPRDHVAAAAAGTRVVFFGGATEPGLDSRRGTVDVYDTVTGLWSTLTLKHPEIDAVGLSAGNQAVFHGSTGDLMTPANHEYLFTDTSAD